MNQSLHTKLVSLILLVSICILGYVSMSTFGEPSAIPGKVSVDSRVQFKQNDNVSYYFGSDSYVDRLEISASYFEIDSLRMSTSVTTGNVNLTLWRFNPSDGYLRWTASEDVSYADVTFMVEGLLNETPYDWFVDGNSVAHTVSDSNGMIQCNYSGPWSSHEFEIQIAAEPIPELPLLPVTSTSLLMSLILIRYGKAFGKRGRPILAE